MLNGKGFSILRPAILGLSVLFALGLTTRAFGQVGGATVKANFGVDADVYADTTQFDGLGVGTGTDDWFDRKAGVSFPGLGVIDTTGGGAFRALLQAAGNAVGRNKTFVRRMPYPFDTVVNGRRWIDAVYARDHITVGGAQDSSGFRDGVSKNGDNPRTWGLGIDGIPAKSDFVDTWAHFRREGALITDSLWLFCGATTISSDGTHHIDYEFFQTAVQSTGTGLTGLGADSGHTAWQASGGVITVPGDLILNVDFTGGGTTPIGSVRLWVKLGPTATGTPYDTAAIRAALGIPFTGVVDQGVEASPFGYAEIQVPAGAVFARVNGIATDVVKSTLGAPWGSLEGPQADFKDSILALQFAEAGINLSRFRMDVSGGNPCISLFGTIMFKTRSSAEFTAALKDFVGPFTFRAIVQVNLDLDSTDVTCYGYNDGTVTATFSGGTAPYTININGGPFVAATSPHVFPGLAAGSYTVVVKDANDCPDTASIVVGEPPVVQLSLTKTDVLCYGSSDGTVTATFSGGTPPYRARIDGGAWVDPATSPYTFTGLAAGSHTVDVQDANDCQKSESITVVQPPDVVLDLDSTDVTCYGYDDGTVTATVLGGTPPYRARIDGGAWVDPATSPYTFTGLAAGSHTVDVQDANDCQKSESITVVQPPDVVLDLDSTDVTCYGYDDGTVTATVLGGTPPYRLRINGGAWVDPATPPFTWTDLAPGLHIVDVQDANGCQDTDSISVWEPPDLVLDLDSTDVTCFGYNDGTVTAIVSGGTPPYQARIDSGAWVDTFIFTDLAPGSHTVDVQDANGCQKTDSINVWEPPELVLDLDSTDVTCYGLSDGEVTATFSGGTPPYRARINGGAWVDPATPPFTWTDLAPGLYTVDVEDANGCQESKSITVVQPPELVLDLDSTDVTCFGLSDGEVTATFSGGTPPYRARIDAGAWVDPATSPYTFTGLAAGLHIVDVEDANGCQKSESITVIAPPVVVLDLDSTDVTCFGLSDGEVTATFSGGTPPYRARINGGAWVDPATPPFTWTDLAPGLYTVDVEDANGCQDTESINVWEPPDLILDLDSTDVTCYGDSDGTITATFSGGTAPYTININGEPFEPATSPHLFPGLAAGSYTVVVKDANGCQESKSITVVQPPELVLDLDSTDVTCYGLSDGEVTATFSGGTPPYRARIDGGGWVDPATSPYTFTGLAAGSHTVDVEDANGCQKSESITVVQPPDLVLDLDSTDVTCFGLSDGTVTATFSGGTPPYRARIDGGAWVDPATSPHTFTGLAAGLHIVDVEDANGCQKSKSITVVQPPELSCSVSPADTTISVGGTATFTDNSTGGTPPYTYCWQKEPYTDSCISTSAILTISNAALADSGEYRVIVIDDNSCADTCGCTLVVIAQPDSCTNVFIEEHACVNPGDYTTVNILLDNNTTPFGGFELEVEFDYTAMCFVDAERGEMIPEPMGQQPGFEYFTYRLLPCPLPPCIKYKILLYGQYDIPNGSGNIGIPIPTTPLGVHQVLVKLNFVVMNNENLRGFMIPVCWEWEGTVVNDTLVEDWNCQENTFSSWSGDTLFTSDLLCQFKADLCDDPTDRIQPCLCFQRHVCGDNCGGVLVCDHEWPECKRGDVNMNELTYEVADAVLFASYFVGGLEVFRYDQAYQVCATDVNADGRPLTLSDLMYLIRVILHDAVEIPKLTPSSEVVNVIVYNKTITTECASPIGAILFEFDGAVVPTLLADMEMVNKDNKVLVWSRKGHSIKAASEVLSFAGDAELVSVTAVDYDTRELLTSITAKVAPTEFALNPAYPNPFNPFTNLSFTLPEAVNYNLKIYNVAGQLVRSYEGMGSVGLNVIGWDGKDNAGDEVSSGVYFYKLTAGGFSATQKMVMMK